MLPEKRRRNADLFFDHQLLDVSPRRRRLKLRPPTDDLSRSPIAPQATIALRTRLMITSTGSAVFGHSISSGVRPA